MSDNVKSGVGALVYATKTKRYLFLLRNSQKYAGSWGLVGGKVENNERIVEGLYREALEEINVDLSGAKTIPIETFTADNSQFIYHTFLVIVDDEFVPELNREHRGYAWLEMRDYPRPLHPGLFRTVQFSVIMEKIRLLESIL